MEGYAAGDAAPVLKTGRAERPGVRFRHPSATICIMYQLLRAWPSGPRQLPSKQHNRRFESDCPLQIDGPFDFWLRSAAFQAAQVGFESHTVCQITAPGAV